MKKVSRQGCKQFWKTVKSLKKASSQIPTLKTDSIIASSNTAKASLLNDVFSQNFNTSTPPLTDIDYHHFMADPSSPYPEEIFCTEETAWKFHTLDACFILLEDVAIATHALLVHFTSVINDT